MRFNVTKWKDMTDSDKKAVEKAMRRVRGA